MSPLLVKAVAAVGTGIGLMALRALFANPDFVLTRYFHKYVARLDHDLKFIASPVSPKLIAVAQIALFLAVAAMGLSITIPYEPIFLLLIVFAPIYMLHRNKGKRVEQLELQVDGFLLAFANALKAVPSPGAALLTVLPVLRDPMRQEIDRVLKEVRIGSTLEDAFGAFSARYRSRTLDGALSAVLIGMQVGGDLPGVLATTAGALREMQRLDGVVRTKTAEGKAQLWVLALFPFALIYLFNVVQEGYFEPLKQSFTGYVISTMAVGFWLAALGAARKILTVDI